MADNVVVSAGTGTTVAADEVVDGTLGTVKVQYVKIMDATLDGTTKAAVGAGGLKVDPTSSVAMNTGTRSATTQRVTVATDDLVPVSLAAETTKVIGVTRTADGAGNLLTSTTNALDVNIKSGVNANGSATSANSAPVVIASDQAAVTTQLSSTANIVSGVISSAMTGTTSTSLVAAPGASLRNYITTLTVSNSHATVGTDILIQDGSGGTTIWVVPAAAVYGGAVIVFNPPLKQPTTNTALFCANVTTGASTKVSANGFKGA